MIIEWVSYCLCEGFLWGCIFSHNGGQLLKDKPYNVHIAVLPMRLLVLIVLTSSGNRFLFDLVAFLLMFPFFQNGMQYETRGAWEPGVLNYHWWSTSTTTTARTNYNFTSRTIMLLIGLGIWLIGVNVAGT